MAMITYPLNDIDYSAADAGLFHCTRKSGVWAEDSFQISATGANNSVTVGSGVAWISNDKYWGKVVAQKESVTIDLDIADAVYNRVDAIVIQFDSNKNKTEVVVKKGTPAKRPKVPEIVQTESIFELCLCTVLRPAGSSVVTFANITDTRLNPEICGLMADSVTKIDTEAINKQAMDLILELSDSIDNVKNGTDVLLKSGLYPVGSIFVTSLNETPGKYLGGTWEIFDKDFDSSTGIFKDVFKKNQEVSECEVAVIRTGKTIKLRLYITLAMDFSPSDNVTLGSIDFEKIGITRITYEMYDIPQGFKGRNCIFMSKLGNMGNVSIADSVHKSINTDILFEAGDKFYLEFELNVTRKQMLDEFCSKFYWKRVE